MLWRLGSQGSHDMKNACWKIKAMEIKCGISGVHIFVWQIEGNAGKTLKSWLLSACSSETPGYHRSQRTWLKWNDNRKLKYWSKQVQENIMTTASTVRYTAGRRLLCGIPSSPQVSCHSLAPVRCSQNVKKMFKADLPPLGYASPP